MTSARLDDQPSGVFRVQPVHNPTNKSEKYKRVHYFVSRLGLAVSDKLQEALIELRRSAYDAPNPELQQLACKGYSDEEFVGAVKELLCIWLHQEAVDQGGPQAPPWIMGFLRLAFGATDLLVPAPRAIDVFGNYNDCDDMRSLCRAASIRTAYVLGFGEHSPLFAAGVAGLLVHNRAERQTVLKDALTMPLDTILIWQPS